ncbi:MAG: phosphosulfolactate synthase [Hylemonella sp.]|nr:phosphosulfolactate synthase [Hylemonella sp.]
MLSQNFLDTPKRISKPRDFGLTALIDNGVPTRYFTDVVESDAALIDVVKFGWCTAMVTSELEKKIQCLIDNDVMFYFGGTLFEKALAQKKLDAFYRFLKHYNCQIVEISNGTLPLSSEEKGKHIADFADEFYVLSEVGKKDIDEADNMPISQWIAEIHADLSAGAKRVILEARESGKSGICDAQGRLRSDLVESITNAQFSSSDAIWEAPTKALQTKLIAALGPNVNLGNIAFGDVIGLETLRLGIRSDTFSLYDGPDGRFVEPEAKQSRFSTGVERRRKLEAAGKNAWPQPTTLIPGMVRLK